MKPKIAVVVQVDLDGRQVRIVVTGAVTEVNQQGLCPVIDRARRLVPGIRVVVDLRGAASVERAAMDLLRWSTEHEHRTAGAPPVEFLLTDPDTATLPEEGAAQATGTVQQITMTEDYPVEVLPGSRKACTDDTYNHLGGRQNALDVRTDDRQALSHD